MGAGISSKDQGARLAAWRKLVPKITVGSLIAPATMQAALDEIAGLARQLEAVTKERDELRELTAWLGEG